MERTEINLSRLDISLLYYIIQYLGTNDMLSILYCIILSNKSICKYMFNVLIVQNAMLMSTISSIKPFKNFGIAFYNLACTANYTIDGTLIYPYLNYTAYIPHMVIRYGSSLPMPTNTRDMDTLFNFCVSRGYIAILKSIIEVYGSSSILDSNTFCGSPDFDIQKQLTYLLMENGYNITDGIVRGLLLTGINGMVFITKLFRGNKLWHISNHEIWSLRKLIITTSKHPVRYCKDLQIGIYKLLKEFVKHPVMDNYLSQESLIIILYYNLENAGNLYALNRLLGNNIEKVLFILEGSTSGNIISGSNMIKGALFGGIEVLKFIVKVPNMGPESEFSIFANISDELIEKTSDDDIIAMLDYLFSIGCSFDERVISILVEFANVCIFGWFMSKIKKTIDLSNSPDIGLETIRTYTVANGEGDTLALNYASLIMDSVANDNMPIFNWLIEHRSMFNVLSPGINLMFISIDVNLRDRICQEDNYLPLVRLFEWVIVNTDKYGLIWSPQSCIEQLQAKAEDFNDQLDNISDYNDTLVCSAIINNCTNALRFFISAGCNYNSIICINAAIKIGSVSALSILKQHIDDSISAANSAINSAVNSAVSFSDGIVGGDGGDGGDAVNGSNDADLYDDIPNRRTCWDNSDLCAKAAYYGHIDVLDWLKANNCPFDADRCKRSAMKIGGLYNKESGSRWAIFQYLNAHSIK
jgi:hypothetical protein